MLQPPAHSQNRAFTSFVKLGLRRPCPWGVPWSVDGSVAQALTGDMLSCPFLLTVPNFGAGVARARTNSVKMSGLDYVLKQKNVPKRVSCRGQRCGGAWGCGVQALCAVPSAVCRDLEGLEWGE